MVTKASPIESMSPYQLFKGDDHQMNLFLKHCRTCMHDVLDFHEPGCPIISVLIESIANNKDLRWDPKWIEIVKGWPVCLQYAKKDKE